MKRNYSSILWLIIVAILLLSSCTKYLDKKPESRMYVPEKWEDFQALLDKNSVFNFQSVTSLSEVIADDYYALTELWQSTSADVRSAHIWDDESIQFQDAWAEPYRAVYTSNVVLEGINKIKAKTPPDIYNNMEGTALFYRANSFYSLLQIYSKPYCSTSETDLGIILKTAGDIDESLPRSTVLECYTLIINDLLKSVDLLPQNAANIMRPGKTAARALLARIYLSMADFTNAGKYAALVLQQHTELLDFNNLIPEQSPMLPTFLSNPEIIFFTSPPFNEMISPVVVNIDSTLYRSYNDNDIRKKVYFAPSLIGTPDAYYFQGGYFDPAPYFIFNGLTSGEMYLIMAECLVRQGKTVEGLNYLNTFLKKRYKNGLFSEYNSSDKDEALEIVLKERRKELVFRGLRWSDIKRLNAEGKNITLKRVLNGTEYILPPNDPRSVMLIPNTEITRSGIKQNPR